MYHYLGCALPLAGLEAFTHRGSTKRLHVIHVVYRAGQNFVTALLMTGQHAQAQTYSEKALHTAPAQITWIYHHIPISCLCSQGRNGQKPVIQFEFPPPQKSEEKS
jgi:hypothetical protein